MISQVVQRIEEVLAEIDGWIDICNFQDIDCSRLVVVQETLADQVAYLRGDIAYKIEQYEGFDTPLEDEDIDQLKSLVDEVGYDSVLALFGDNVRSILQTARGE